MRPFTLTALQEFLAILRNGGVEYIEHDRRLRELLSASLDLGFVQRLGSGYVITERGLAFLSAVANRDANTVHAILMESMEPYRRIYELISSGVTKPSDLALATGYNAVIIDVVLRLIGEVEGLGSGEVNEGLYGRFEKVLIDKYRALSRRFWSKYVPISELLNEVRRESHIPPRLINKLLEEFVRRWGSKVVLVNAPSTGGKNFVELFGRRYAYILIEVS
ncbi:MAG: hypothetical protein ACP5NQ_00370 [Vulcanisaeta sp.]